MSLLGIVGPVGVFVASFAVNALVLSYHSESFPRLRALVDRANRGITGRTDWGWLRLRHLMAFLGVVAVGSTLWNLATLRCSNDVFALLASGQAALHGQNPFSVEFCGGPAAEQIPYGLAAVSVNALGAASGSVVGVWIAWELVALAVVPLVWSVGGAERRFVSVVATTSVVYLPNITNNIGGLENAIVPVSVLLMLAGLAASERRRTLRIWVAAFFSTARFPAVFPLLGSSSGERRGKGAQLAIVLGVFSGAVLFSTFLWGGDAVQVVYLGQVTRGSSESLNLFALLVHQGWFHPSLAVAGVQGAGLVALLCLVHWRGYSSRTSAGVLLVGLMLFSQYLNYHFTEWLIPLVLLGAAVNWWLLILGTVMVADENLAYWYLAVGRGVWWPYELAGVVLTALLVTMVLEIVRSEEARMRLWRPSGSTGNQSPGAGI